MTLDRFREVFQTHIQFPDEEDENYHTMAGFVLHQLGRIPTEAESFEWNEYYFEVMDMDKHRIDRLLVNVKDLNESEEGTDA